MSKIARLYILILFIISIFQITNVNSLTSINQINKQLHRYYYDNDPYYRSTNSSGRGIGLFSALIVSIACGLCCFAAILYYFKWKRQRETGQTHGFFDFANIRAFMGQSVPINNQYPQQPVQRNPGYYNQPNNPNSFNYPNL